MDADTHKRLREPFSAEVVGKLPRVWCGKCRNAQFKVCDQHQSVKCNVCSQKISNAHLHIDYVGHAAITDRLLQVDHGWSWEPVAFGPDGLPVLDKNGGLWIRLTVAGVTRLGYGDAEGKNGPAAVKEAIGDALRNGAMRFGVGLDLWHKDGVLAQHDDEPAPAPQRQDMGSGVSRGGSAKEQQVNGNARQRAAQPAQDAAAQQEGGGGKAADAARRMLWAKVEQRGLARADVEARYTQQYGGETIEQATDANRLVAFSKLLPEAATNGAAQ